MILFKLNLIKVEFMSIEPFYIVEDYITSEQCSNLLKYFIENEDEDPREFYGNLGLGGGTDFHEGPEEKSFSFDPDKVLNKMIAFGKNFILEKYEMRGPFFELNRSHVNYMHVGAFLHSHRDDRNGDESIEDLNSMTYVMGLFLNDDYEGGELVFEDYNTALKPKAGSLVFFPGFYTRHEVKEITKGVRINILSHFFNVVDNTIAYKPNYVAVPSDSSKIAI